MNSMKLSDLLDLPKLTRDKAEESLCRISEQSALLVYGIPTETDGLTRFQRCRSKWMCRRHKVLQRRGGYSLSGLVACNAISPRADVLCVVKKSGNGDFEPVIENPKGGGASF